jgi:hypothetical protein
MHQFTPRQLKQQHGRPIRRIDLQLSAELLVLGDSTKFTRSGNASFSEAFHQ